MTGTSAAIPAIPAGCQPAAADFDAWVQAPLTFLTTRVVFRAEYHGTKSIPALTATLIPFDTILEDPYSGWNATTFAWTCPSGCSGWYEVTLTVFTTNPGATTDQLCPLVYASGTEYMQTAAVWGVDGHDTGSSGSVILPLEGTFDYVQGYAFSTVAVSTTATAGQYCTIEIAWISE
jgi:hypothetical protein